MGINKPFIYSSLLAFFMLSCTIGFGQIKVEKATAGTPALQGAVYYTLPATQFVVTLQIEKTQNYKGPFADLAPEMLGVKEVIKYNSTTYRILDTRIQAQVVPDASQLYQLVMEGKTSKESQSTHLGFSASGLITAWEDTAKLQVMPTVKMHTGDVLADGRTLRFRYAMEPLMVEQVDTIIRKIAIDTSTVERVEYRRTRVEQPLEIRARHASDKIMQIREERYNLLTGYQEVAYPAGTMKIMVDELRKMEDELISLFKGCSVSHIEEVSFLVQPKADERRLEMGLFSSTEGVRTSGGDGEKIVAEWLAHGLVDQLPEEEAGKGLVYRIPEPCLLVVKVGQQELAKKSVSVSQFGRTARMPAHPVAKQVQIDPQTGMLRRILLEQ